MRWNRKEHAETPPGTESIAAESFAQKNFAYVVKVACGNDTVVPGGESSTPTILVRVPVCKKRGLSLSDSRAAPVRAKRPVESQD